MLEKIEETANFLSAKVPQPPRIGLITGTGLGGITARMDTDLRMAYSDIPHFPQSTTVGHRGILAFGRFAGRAVVAMAAGIFLCTWLLISDSAHERPAAFFNLEMRRSAFTRRRPIGRPEGV